MFGDPSMLQSQGVPLMRSDCKRVATGHNQADLSSGAPKPVILYSFIVPGISPTLSRACNQDLPICLVISNWEFTTTDVSKELQFIADAFDFVKMISRSILHTRRFVEACLVSG